MYCTKCGMLNNDNALFCYGCGAKIEKPQAVNPQQEAAKATQQIPVQSGQAQYASQAIPNNYSQPQSKPLSPNIAGIIISVLLIISCFLPFLFVGYKRYGETYLFLEVGVGLLVLLAGIAAVIFSIFDKKWGMLGPGIASIVCYVISVIIVISNYNKNGISLKDLSRMFGEILHLRIGFIAVPVCAIALIICGVSAGHDYIESRDTNELLGKLRDQGNSSSYWACYLCGARNALYIGTCKCGTNKSDPRNVVKQPAKNGTHPISQSAKCPSCGRLVHGTQTSCSNCGARLIR